ncbi:MAG: hypothetical protein II707_02825 [Spirochaetales bacterium]|nr:hypothetical protein [Spirochaetales bacterium]
MKKIFICVVLMCVTMSMFAGGFDYRGEWRDGFTKYVIKPDYYTVKVYKTDGTAITYNGKVQIKDDNHIIVYYGNNQKLTLSRITVSTGAIIGGAIGAVVGGPIGGAAGAVIGNELGKKSDKK